MTPRIIIIGAGGRIGHQMFAALGPGAIGTHRAPAPGLVRFDMAEDDLADVMERPESVTHAVITAGMANPAAIVADPAKARKTNLDGTLRLIDRLVTWGITPVFTSSDAVLGLGDGPFTEAAPVQPTTLYGQLKCEVEEYMASLSADWLVFRLSRVYGMEMGDGTLITSLLQRLMAGGCVPVASDQKFAPVFIGDVVEAIQRAVRRRLTGLYHLGGPQIVTHLSIAQSLLAQLGQQRNPTATLEPRPLNSFVSYETRPLDISMDSSKIERVLEMDFMDVDAAIGRIVAAVVKNKGLAS